MVREMVLSILPAHKAVMLSWALGNPPRCRLCATGVVAMERIGDCGGFRVPHVERIGGCGGFRSGNMDRNRHRGATLLFSEYSLNHLDAFPRPPAQRSPAKLHKRAEVVRRLTILLLKNLYVDGLPLEAVLRHQPTIGGAFASSACLFKG